MEHCYAATAGLPEAERIGIADYDAVTTEYDGVGLGDWIFAVPPFRDDARVRRAVSGPSRERGVPEAAIAKAVDDAPPRPGVPRADGRRDPRRGPRASSASPRRSARTSRPWCWRRSSSSAIPSLAIVFGGTNCDGPMGAALHRAFPWVDVVVRGEAERMLPELMRDLVAGGPRASAARAVLPRRRASRWPSRRPAVSEVAMDEIPLPIVRRVLRAAGQDQLRAGDRAGRPARLRERARVLVGREVALHVLRRQRHQHGLPQQEPGPRRRGADRAGPALPPARLRDRGQHPRPRLLPRGPAPAARARATTCGCSTRPRPTSSASRCACSREAGVNRIQPGLESLSTPILKSHAQGRDGLPERAPAEVVRRVRHPRRTGT